MCLGSVTVTSCGHNLTHFSEPCERETQCDTPLGPETHLESTCADCDPEYRVNRLNREYEERIKQYQKELDSDEVLQTIRREMDKISLRYSGPEGDLYSNVTHPQGTCKWIDGRAVWTDEEDDPIRASLQATYPHIVSPAKADKRHQSSKKKSLEPEEIPIRSSSLSGKSAATSDPNTVSSSRHVKVARDERGPPLYSDIKGIDRYMRSFPIPSSSYSSSIASSNSESYDAIPTPSNPSSSSKGNNPSSAPGPHSLPSPLPPPPPPSSSSSRKSSRKNTRKTEEELRPHVLSSSSPAPSPSGGDSNGGNDNGIANHDAHPHPRDKNKKPNPNHASEMIPSSHHHNHNQNSNRSNNPTPPPPRLPSISPSSSFSSSPSHPPPPLKTPPPPPSSHPPKQPSPTTTRYYKLDFAVSHEDRHLHAQRRHRALHPRDYSCPSSSDRAAKASFSDRLLLLRGGDATTAAAAAAAAAIEKKGVEGEGEEEEEEEGDIWMAIADKEQEQEGKRKRMEGGKQKVEGEVGVGIGIDKEKKKEKEKKKKQVRFEV